MHVILQPSNVLENHLHKVIILGISHSHQIHMNMICTGVVIQSIQLHIIYNYLMV